MEHERYVFDCNVDGASDSITPGDAINVTFGREDGIDWVYVERRGTQDGRPCIRRRRIPAARVKYHYTFEYADEVKPAAKPARAAKPAAA
jgi:hypothetical protein